MSHLGADSQRVVFLAYEQTAVYITMRSSHYVSEVAVAPFLHLAGSPVPRRTPLHHRPSGVRVVGMMVFDRRTCTWRVWHGTRATWLKLPHVVVTAVCVASTAALRSAAPLPAHPVERVLSLRAPPPAVSAPAPATQAPVAHALGTPMPAAAFLSSPWFLALTSGGDDGSGTSLSPIPPIGRSSFTPNLPIIPATPIVPPARVPEPGSLTLLAGAVLALAAMRRRHFPRWVRKEPPNQ